jgi:biotin carboxyl carrier protein
MFVHGSSFLRRLTRRYKGRCAIKLRSAPELGRYAALSVTLGLAGCGAADGSHTAARDAGTAVMAGVTGVAASAPARVGAHVERGQLLARIDAPELVRVLRVADIEHSRLSLVLSRQLRERAQLRRFVEQGLGSRTWVESLDTEVAHTKAQIATLERIQRETAERLAARELRAPFAGCVLTSGLDVGDSVRQGEVLYTLGADGSRAGCVGLAAPRLAQRDRAAFP